MEYLLFKKPEPSNREVLDFAKDLFLRNNDFVVFVDHSNMENVFSNNYEKIKIYKILCAEHFDDIQNNNNHNIIIESNYHKKYDFIFKIIDSQTFGISKSRFHTVKYGDILRINWKYRLNETFFVGLDNILYFAGNFDFMDNGNLFIPIKITAKIENPFIFYSNIEYEYMEILMDTFLKNPPFRFLTIFNTLSRKTRKDFEKSQIVCLHKKYLFYHSELKLSKKDTEIYNDYFPLLENTFDYIDYNRLIRW